MDGVCYCPNATALMEELGAKHDAENWRLFIDSSKTSLKAVLLHNGNTKPSIPLAHAVGMKETYDSMKRILELIHYEYYKWKICGDLKVISLVLGLQLGYTKHMCFLCLWNSRDDRNHFFVKKWPSRVDHEVGRYNGAAYAFGGSKKSVSSSIAHQAWTDKKLCKSNECGRKWI